MYNKKDVLNLLPHRDPFLFIDSCSSVSLSKEEIEKVSDIKKSNCTAHVEIPENHDIFKGHFPEKKVLPGVIHSEIMAQSTVFIVDQFRKNYKGDTSNLDIDNLIGVLVSIDSLKLKNPIFPNVKLSINTEISAVIQNLIVVKSEIIDYNSKKIYSKGTLKLAIVSKEKIK